ncbi:ATP-binding protein [Bacteriovoracaceae bacterium]|nr:ATP-binding protein [Bacteriovoracaceae bacterium]
MLSILNKSIKNKLIFSTLFIVVIATVLVAIGIYFTVLTDLQKSMGQRLQHIASTGSLLIEGKTHHDIYKQYVKQVPKEEIEKSKSFLDVQKTLRNIKNINNLEQDIYTVVLPKWLKKDKKMLFMAMSNHKPYIGNGLERSEIASQVLNTKTAQYSEIYEDSEGQWISALAPIFTVTKKGKKRVVALLEVDYDVTEEVHAVQMNLLKKSLLWSTVGILFSLFIIYFVSNALSSPIIELTGHTRKAIDGNWAEDLKIQRADEIGILADSMRSMVSEIVISRNQLEDYAHNLEQKVKERTKELNDTNTKLTCILDSLGQGLFLINSDYNIDSLYAKVTDSFLAKPLNAMQIKDFYIEEFDIDRTFKVLFNELIPFEDGISLLPTNIRKKNDDMFLDISYKPIVTNDGIDKILVIITDKTYEVLSEKKLKQKEIETNRLLSIFGSQRELKSFIEDAKERVLDAKELIKKEVIDLSLIKGHAHTIKGGASWFYEEPIIQMTTKIEDLCLSLQANKDSMPQDINIDENLDNYFSTLENNFEDFIKFTSSTLGYDVEGDDIITLKEKDLFSIVKSFGQKREDELFNILLCEDAGELLKTLNNPLKDISKRLNKDLNEITIKSDGSRIYRKLYSEFFDVIVHYVRNIAVHGIEDEDIRLKRNKDKYCGVVFSVKKVNDRLFFSFKDDGNGIDPLVISKKCEELGVDMSGKTDHEIIQGIFTKKVSTSDNKNEWSGLGVGMDVIKSTVDSLGGSVEIFSNFEKGTELIVEMPYLKYKDVNNVTT